MRFHASSSGFTSEMPAARALSKAAESRTRLSFTICDRSGDAAGYLRVPRRRNERLNNCRSYVTLAEHQLVYRVTDDRIDFLQARYHY
jgi:hypothetical protein